MGIDYSQLQHSKGTPGYVGRKQRKKDAEDALDRCYAAVNKRDENTCRVTGARLQPGAVNPDARREHHHLVKRSRDRGLIDDPANVILVSATAHRLIEDGWIVVEGRRADTVLRFHWRTDTPESMKVVRIKSRRRSQRNADL